MLHRVEAKSTVEPAPPTCECGHLISDHQTGEGPWTGFCGGTDRHVGSDGDLTDQCECEAPTLTSGS